MAGSEIVAIVPIRLFPSAKNRLASILDARQREDLVKSMLLDVLKATAESDYITRTIIITYDDALVPPLTDSHFEIHKSSTQGLNEELNECLDHYDQLGPGYGVIILGDLPLLTGKVLDDLIWSGLRTRRAVIAKDWKAMGTNVLFFAYPVRFELCFGESSLQKHIRELESHDLNPILYAAMETALDIDDAMAIDQFMMLAQFDEAIQETSTFALLHHEVKKKDKVA